MSTEQFQALIQQAKQLSKDERRLPQGFKRDLKA